MRSARAGRTAQSGDPHCCKYSACLLCIPAFPDLWFAPIIRHRIRPPNVAQLTRAPGKHFSSLAAIDCMQQSTRISATRAGKLCAVTVALLLGSTMSGCADMWPNWCHPGGAPYQRKEAQRFDPYPVPGAGPDVVGGRPEGFDKPRDEVRQVQNPRSFAERYGQPPPLQASPDVLAPSSVPVISSPAQ